MFWYAKSKTLKTYLEQQCKKLRILLKQVVVKSQTQNKTAKKILMRILKLMMKEELLVLNKSKWFLLLRVR
jgi:hypothetical protein